MSSEGSFAVDNFVCVNICFSQVSIEEGDAKAKEFGVMFIETSSKAGFNIKVRPMHCLSGFVNFLWVISFFRLHIQRKLFFNSERVQLRSWWKLIFCTARLICLGAQQ